MLPEFSQFALQSSFWFDVFTNIFAAVLLSTLAWLIVRLIRIVLHLIHTGPAYHRLTGIWIGVCKLPTHPPGVDAIEIYRLNERKQSVSLRFFQYLPNPTKITRYEGGGIYRDGLLAAFYYIADPHNVESGVLMMRKDGNRFKGVYAQYVLESEMTVFQSPEDFVLRRIQISLWAQVRMLFGRPPFRDYKPVKELYDQAFKVKAQTPIQTAQVESAP